MAFEDDIGNCLQVLHAGGVILYPTDTVWGLGCDATNDNAVRRIYEIKQRPAEKAMIVLAADERQVMQHVAAPDLEVFDFLERAAKPTTVIFPGALGFADNLLADDGSIAIRIVNDVFCKALIKRFRKPIVSTSANISGDPPPTIFMEITAPVKNSVDYVVRYRQDDKTPAVPSAVIKWENGNAVYLRR